jgi:hypothetical protein
MEYTSRVLLSQLNSVPRPRTNDPEVAPRVARKGARSEVPQAKHPPPTIAKTNAPEPLFFGMVFIPRRRSTYIMRAVKKATPPSSQGKAQFSWNY